jgi:hypothetical protein
LSSKKVFTVFKKGVIFRSRRDWGRGIEDFGLKIGDWGMLTEDCGLLNEDWRFERRGGGVGELGFSIDVFGLRTGGTRRREVGDVAKSARPATDAGLEEIFGRPPAGLARPSPSQGD